LFAYPLFLIVQIAQDCTGNREKERRAFEGGSNTSYNFCV